MRVLLLCFFVFILSGCGSFGIKLKNFMRGQGWTEDTGTHKPLSFSDTPNYRKGEKRKYVRMTKEQFEAESKLGPQEGSLWVMEGQGAYLFSQNTVRLIGDLMNVRLEGAGRAQVDTKINVIKKLLKKLENPSRQLASDNTEESKSEKTKDNEKSAKTAPEGKGKETKENSTTKSEGENNKDDESMLGIDVIPTRIVQRLTDGNYRVKGSQSFMIGKREFRVIVAGIVREQDFNDEGISSQALIEPVFDVVSVKKGL